MPPKAEPTGKAVPPKAGTPGGNTTPNKVEPSKAEATAKAAPGKAGIFDKANIFFAVFGVIAAAAGLLTHILLVAIIAGLAYIVMLIIIAIYEKNIKWPAWRVIIAFILVSGVLTIYYVSPKTEAVRINIPPPGDFSGWDITKPPLYQFPVADNPQTGQQYSNFTLEPGQDYDVNAQCWTKGHLTGKPRISVDWVSVKGGSYDGLWIPLEAIAMDNPGLARNLPNCNSWWFKVWPF